MGRPTTCAAILLSAVLLSGAAFAESLPAQKSFDDFPGLAGLTRTSLTDPESNRLDVLRYARAERGPAVVIVPGSLCAPLFAALGQPPDVQAFATVPVLQAAERDALDAHLVYLERRNIVSLQTLASAPAFSVDEIFRLSPCSEHNGGLTLEQRVADVRLQLQWLKRQDGIEALHLVGVSEGADVVAAVAAADPGLADSLMLIGGAGPSQFADFAAFARGRNDVHGVREAFADLDRFLAAAAPAQYKGYDARRWQSFALQTSALDSLAASTVPVFIAHGDRDTSVPIASADLAAVELMRKQPQRAIFYWSVVDGDHMLKTPVARRLPEILRHYVAWARAAPAGRTFRAD